MRACCRYLPRCACAGGCRAICCRRGIDEKRGPHAQITSLLDRRDANGRYVALETLATVSTAPDIAAALRPHLPLVSACLVDADPSVRRRAIDVLVSVCDAHSVEEIVGQLLEHMPRASPEARGDLVVKIAVLAERFPPSLRWYIDTLIALMDAGGDEVGDDVWHRVVHLLSNSERMRARGTDALVAHLQGGTFSVPLISTAGCVPRGLPHPHPFASPRIWRRTHASMRCARRAHQSSRGRKVACKHLASCVPILRLYSSAHTGMCYQSSRTR